MNRGIGIGIGLGFGGNTGGGGVPVDTHQLLTAYDLATGQPVALSDGANLDTPEEGVSDGNIIVIDTGGGSGTVTLSDDEIKIDGGGSWGTTGIRSQALELQDGMLLQFVSEHTTNASSSGERVGGLYAGNVGSVNRYAVVLLGLTAFPAGILNSAGSFLMLFKTLTTDTSYTYSFVIEEVSPDFTDANLFIYIKGGTEYPDTFLLVIATDYDLSGSVFGAESINALMVSRSATVPDAPHPALITPVVTLTTSIQSALSDVYIQGVFTTPASGVTPLEIKFRQSDADNYWLVKVVPGTAGVDLSLHTVEAGVEQAALATSDVDFAISTEYSIGVVCNGDDWCKVIIDNVVKLEMSTTETFNETETGVSQVESAFTSISLKAYQQSGVTIDV